MGGIVIMRAGENALNVIERVKEKLEEIKPSLPKGVEIVTTYDRSTLIERSIDTLKEELLLEIIIVSLVILVFLWHFPSAIIPILTIPVSVVLVFIPLYFMGLTSNIMSLTGIAISIGVLVDGAIVEVENAYKRLEEWIARRPEGRFSRGPPAGAQGGRPFGLLLALGHRRGLPAGVHPGGSGRPAVQAAGLHQEPGMAIAAVLAITLDPAMRMMFTRMDYHSRSGPAGLSGSVERRGGRPVLSRGATPDQQAAVPRLRAGVQLRPASQGAHADRGVAPGADDHPGLLPVGLGVHAAVVRGLAALHAHDRAGHLRGGSPATPANDGQAVARSSRKWSGCSARRAGRRPRPIPRPSR